MIYLAKPLIELIETSFFYNEKGIPIRNQVHNIPYLAMDLKTYLLERALYAVHVLSIQNS